MSTRFPSPRAMYGIAGAVVALDQVTKLVIRRQLGLYEGVSIIPGFLDFRYVQNTGAAFGMLNAADIPFKSAVMTGVALFALIAIALYTRRLSSEERLAKVGLALILGGACGNLVDRATLGFVVDFIDVYWGDWHFWAFNVADAAITVGAAGLILDMAILNRHVSETA